MNKFDVCEEPDGIVWDGEVLDGHPSQERRGVAAPPLQAPDPSSAYAELMVSRTRAARIPTSRGDGSESLGGAT